MEYITATTVACKQTNIFLLLDFKKTFHGRKKSWLHNTGGLYTQVNFTKNVLPVHSPGLYTVNILHVISAVYKFLLLTENQENILHVLQK